MIYNFVAVIQPAILRSTNHETHEEMLFCEFYARIHFQTQILSKDQGFLGPPLFIN